MSVPPPGAARISGVGEVFGMREQEARQRIPGAISRLAAAAFNRWNSTISEGFAGLPIARTVSAPARWIRSQSSFARRGIDVPRAGVSSWFAVFWARCSPSGPAPRNTPVAALLRRGRARCGRGDSRPGRGGKGMSGHAAGGRYRSAGVDNRSARPSYRRGSAAAARRRHRGMRTPASGRGARRCAQFDSDGLVGYAAFGDVPTQHRIMHFRGIVTRVEAVPSLNFCTSHITITIAESA